MLSPDSGLHAEIRDPRGRRVALALRARARLRSAPGGPRACGTLGAGRRRPGPCVEQHGHRLGIRGRRVESFRFIVAQSLEPWRAQRRAFRLGLVGWFGALAVATLAPAGLRAARVMQPLGRIEREIREMETARREATVPAWPEELQGVAANLNALLRRERDRQRRYQESLANLAHSLKTPLAAVRTLLPSEDATQFPASLAPARAAARRAVAHGPHHRLAAAPRGRQRAGGVGIAPVAVAPVAATWPRRSTRSTRIAACAASWRSRRRCVSAATRATCRKFSAT
jgi:two-component system, OmpR family, sensor histidine kinase PhoQ